jgi:diadenosine tetraphosphate (Ap4A) HIT family hydrolase
MLELIMNYNLYMTKRIWDIEGKYVDGFVKEYNHWIVEVSYKQHTIGCYIIFSKREIEKISELSDEEINELKIVMKQMEDALSNISFFKPDRFNYLQLGNALHHLHFHCIPRYDSSRNFNGRTWDDKTYGHPPIWTEDKIDKELVIKIKELIIDQLK